MPTHARCGSSGCGTIVCRISPPAPGSQVSRDGWSVRPRTCVQVAPPSSLRNRPAGSTPARMAPSGVVARLHTVLIGVMPSPSPYVRPSLEWVQVCPRSSLFQTAGPNHGDPPAARIAPLDGSWMRSWMGQPSHSGPRTSQSARGRDRSRGRRPPSGCRRGAGHGTRQGSSDVGSSRAYGVDSWCVPKDKGGLARADGGAVPYRTAGDEDEVGRGGGVGDATRDRSRGDRRARDGGAAGRRVRHDVLRRPTDDGDRGRPSRSRRSASARASGSP